MNLLTSNDHLKEAQRILMPPVNPPTGQVDRDSPFTTLDFSSWLGLVVESQLRDLSGWTEADPIALGSWGRGELCPHSDLDVLFCGPEGAVKKVVEQVEERGMKLRYRVPQDLKDWREGVGVFDINALFWAKPFTRQGAVLLQEQKKLILEDKREFRKTLLHKMLEERQKRQARYDSIANFLEPNLKFGAGGLRDILQAVFLQFWFSEKFTISQHAFRVLSYYRKFFLIVRQKLHMQTGMDILVAPEQPDLAQWFDFSKNAHFMREVQKGIARVSFHSDWVVGQCKASAKKIQQYENANIKSWKEAFELLEKDSSVLQQYQVRRALYETQKFKNKNEKQSSLGKKMREAFSVEKKDSFLVSLFRSQMISHGIPTFSSIIGLVQHDQYHRFSVDAHLLQAMREVKKVYRKPALLGKLAGYAKGMLPVDWEILTWAALYHDIAKGQGGSHARKGRDIALKELSDFGLPKKIVSEVAWLVENHLILSTAAFRKNARAKKTWRDLYEKGVMGMRIQRLTLFTAMDIRATNPDAWTSWKEHLLFELAETLKDPSTEKYIELNKSLLKAKISMEGDFVENLGLVVVENVPHLHLVADFKSLRARKVLKPLIFKDKNGYVWIRFQTYRDQKGLFLEYVRKLTSLGCNIRYAGVMTDKVYGVYDWFQVKTKSNISSLLTMLGREVASATFSGCNFSEIQLVNQDSEEWVFSFRARDKKGLLVSASQALVELNLEILWAKVFTWGRQIDDVFGVKPLPGEDSKDILKKLRTLLVQSPVELPSNS